MPTIAALLLFGLVLALLYLMVTCRECDWS